MCLPIETEERPAQRSSSDPGAVLAAEYGALLVAEAATKALAGPIDEGRGRLRVDVSGRDYVEPVAGRTPPISGVCSHSSSDSVRTRHPIEPVPIRNRIDVTIGMIRGP